MIWNPYKRRTEIDSRQEMINSIEGVYPETVKAQRAVLRKMRRDINNQLIKCSCVDRITQEPDKDNFCPFCFGDGNLWDEVFMDIIPHFIEQSNSQVKGEDLTQAGLHNISLMVFYTRYSEIITKDDKVVQLVLTNEGKITDPPKRNKIFRIVRPVDYRLESGRLEYWKLSCFEEEVRFLNGVNG